MEVTIYEPNQALAEALTSPQMHAAVEERINTAAMLYQAEVAKRTGALAAAVHTHVGIGGIGHDRMVGELVVGGAGPRGKVDYGAAREYGADVVVDGERHVAANEAHHDLQQVLEQLGDH